MIMMSANSSVFSTTFGTWKHRNVCVIEGKPPNFFKFHREVEFDIEATRKVFVNSNGSTRDSVIIQWIKLKNGMIKLNTNGSSLRNPGPAGFGGLFRDDNGRWLCGYSCYLGTRTNMFAELSTIKQGLSLAVNKGFLRIEVDSDCLEAINLISKSDNSIHYLGVIISYIKALGSRFEAISFNHVFREVNHCADALAKLGSKDRVELHVWENPPSVISLGLMADLAATSFYRM